MAFLVPFMMYPLALAISGLVRLERSVRGRPRESAPRITAVLGAAACALLVGVPVALNTIPGIVEKVTGNTPANTLHTSDGEVLAAAPAGASRIGRPTRRG
jgi:hypothetical protein